jgi:hypothetical protein
MNSIQLAQRLGRNLVVPDPFNLDAEPALDVVSAINAGLNSYFRELPGIYKRAPLSHTLRGPRSVSITYLSQYGHEVGESSFEPSMIGCTLRLGNGAADTQITGSNTVLDDYLGESLGPIPATVYSDAIPIQDVIERIIGNVRLYDNSQSQPTVLVRDERLRGGRAGRLRQGSWGEDFTADCGLYAIGRPRYYYLDPAGLSQGAEPEFLLRVAPWPDKDYTVRMEAELQTQRILFTDLITARAILVPDAHVDDILIPLCEAELITSPYWRDKSTVNAVLERQKNVLATKLTKIPSDIAPSSNFVGTPPGF